MKSKKGSQPFKVRITFFIGKISKKSIFLEKFKFKFFYKKDRYYIIYIYNNIKVKNQIAKNLIRNLLKSYPQDLMVDFLPSLKYN